MVGFLYGQTEYSLLENTIHLSDYIKLGVLNEYAFLTITDNNLYGHFKFYELCKENKIKPLIGLKVKIHSEYKNNYILCYAKTEVGYKNLVEIATELELNKEVSDEFILAHNEGLAFVSSALDSNLDYFLYEENSEEFYHELKRLQGFGEFYFGVMPSSFMHDTICDEVKRVIKEENLIALPISKTSYLSDDELLAYHALLKLNDEKITLGYDDLHFKTKAELTDEFSEYEGIFENLETFVNSFSSEVISFNHPLPKYPNKYGLTSKEYLANLCLKGLERRILKENLEGKDKYYERLNYELEVINKMGYADYFLIVWDFVLFAKKHGVLVGPGRGSAAGSLVSYALGITEINPLKYDLLFERFLNPERVSMPDIDLDFPDDKRDYVINYVKEKYGIDHVCYITAFGSFQLKSSIRDLFRINGYDQKYIEPIIKLLSTNPTEEAIESEFSNHQELIELIKVAKIINGLPRHISTHAAGIILSSQSLFEAIPLREGLNGMYQAQLEAVDLEKMGLLKIDFLGIRNLTIIDNVAREIKKVEPDFNLNKLDLNDSKTFKLLQKGDTLGIFQLESAGITNVLKKMQPNCFEDLVAVLALYRPGPMENIDPYIERKHGKSFNYLHPDLEPILKDTYGIIVYQEQIMKIGLKFAGYTLGEADILRRAVSKKKLDVLESERVKFVKRSVALGYEEKIANNIYDYIVKFANYGFNRSHSVAYGLFSYVMAYLKANYKNVFLAKLLNNVIGNDSELKNYISYCNLSNILVFSPNINYSTNQFLIGHKGLLMPINAIHNLGSIATREIINEREKGKFLSFNDFKARMGSKVNSRMLESLINAGAFDCFNLTHAYLLKNISGEFEEYLSDSEINTEEKELSKEELALKEFEALGFNLRFNPFKEYEQYKTIYKATNPADLKPGKLTNMIGLISRVKELTTKKGDLMAFITLNCNNSLVDVVCFGSEYNLYHNLFETKKLVLVQGKVQSRNENLQLVLSKMKELN